MFKQKERKEAKNKNEDHRKNVQKAQSREILYDSQHGVPPTSGWNSFAWGDESPISRQADALREVMEPPRWHYVEAVIGPDGSVFVKENKNKKVARAIEAHSEMERFRSAVTGLASRDAKHSVPVEASTETEQDTEPESSFEPEEPVEKKSGLVGGLVDVVVSGVQSQMPGFATKAVDAALKHPQIRPLVDGFKTIGEKIQAIWENTPIRILLLSLISASIVRYAVKRYHETSGLRKAFDIVERWVRRLISYLPLESIHQHWQELVVRFTSTPRATGEIKATSENLHHSIGSIGALVGGFLVLALFGSQGFSTSQAGRIVDSVSKAGRSFFYLQRGMSSLSSMVDWVVDRLPVFAKKFMNEFFGFGSLDPEVFALRERYTALHLRVLAYGQKFWCTAVNRSEFSELRAQVQRLKGVHATRVQGAFEVKVLQDVERSMREIAPSEIAGDVTALTSTAVVLIGDAGMGKSLFYGVFGSLHSPDKGEAVWQVNEAADHSDGYNGQIIQVYDDKFAARTTQGEDNNFITNLLQLTSSSACFIRGADLADKGKLNLCEYTFITTNLSLRNFYEKFATPAAIKRRLLGDKHCLFEFVPTSLVRRQGVYDPKLLSTLTAQQFADGAHVDIILHKYVEGRYRKIKMRNRMEAFAYILAARRACIDEDARELNHALADWKHGLPARVINTMREEGEEFDTGRFQSVDYPIVSARQRPRFCTLLRQAILKELKRKESKSKSRDRLWRPAERQPVSLDCSASSFLAELKEPEEKAETKNWAAEIYKAMRRFGDPVKKFTAEKIARIVSFDVGRPVVLKPGVMAPRERFAYERARIDERVKEALGVDVKELMMYLGGGLLFAALALGEVEDVKQAFKWVKNKFNNTINLASSDDPSEVCVIMVDKDDVGRYVPARSESLKPKTMQNRNRTVRPRLRNARQINGKVEMRVSDIMQDPNQAGRVRRISRNVVSITTRNGTACGTFMGTNVLAVNPHLFTTIGDSKSAFPVMLPRQDFTVVTRLNPTQEPQAVRMTFEPQNFKVPEFHDSAFLQEQGYTPINDVGFLVAPIGQQFRPYATLTNLCLDRSQWLNLRGCPAYVVDAKGGLKALGPLDYMADVYWTAPAYDVKTGRIVNRAYHTGHDLIFTYPGTGPDNPGNSPGRCGCPVLCFYRGTIHIVGIHVAQYGNSTRGMAAALDPDYLRQGMLLPRRGFLNARPECAMPYFQADTEEQVCSYEGGFYGPSSNLLGTLVKPGHIPRVSKLYPSVFSGRGEIPAPETSPYRPADLAVSLEERLVNSNVLQGPTVLDWDLFGICVDDTLERFGGEVKHSTAMPVVATVSGFRHPLCAFPAVSPLDLSTSAGRRRKRVGLAGKKHCVTACTDGVQEWYEPDARLTSDIGKILAACTEGLPNESWELFYKDEALKISKVLEGRTRIIRLPTMALTCALRSEFAGPFNDFFSRANTSESCVGMNPESREFCAFIRAMLAVGDRDGFFDSDIHAMDENHRLPTIEAIARALNRRFTNRDKDQLRFNLFMSQFVRTEVCGSDLVLVTGIMPSGTPFTTFLNVVSIVSHLKYGFLKHQRSERALASLEMFHRCVVAGALGDDLMGCIARGLTTFNPTAYARYLSYDDCGNRMFTVTSAAKDVELGWRDIHEATFLSRNIGEGSLPGLPGCRFFPVFSMKRLMKSLTWFRKGELSDRDLTLTKANNALLLVLGHGPRRFAMFREMLSKILRDEGIEGYLRRWNDCIEIWNKPEAATANFILAHAEMEVVGAVADASASLSNVVNSVVQSVDKVAHSMGFDLPNVGLNPPLTVLGPPSLSNARNVSNFQHAALSSAPMTKEPESGHFGIADDTSLETLCRPTYLETVMIDDSSQAGDIVAEGWLTACPILGTAVLGDMMQPVACGYTLACFNTAKYDVVVTLDAIVPSTFTARFAFAALPGVSEVPGALEDIQRPYLTYFQVSAEEATHSFVVPYQSNTARKFIPNGPLTLDNSFGKWAIFLVSELAYTSTVVPIFDINLFYGLQNITADNWGLRNLSLTPLLADQKIETSVESKKTKSKMKEVVNHNRRFVMVSRSRQARRVNAKAEMMKNPSPAPSIGLSDAKAGIVIAEEQTAETPRVLVPTKQVDASSATAENHWTMAAMATRPQLVGTFEWNDSQPNGTTIAQIAVPDEAIIGTHTVPFSQFLQMQDGVCELTARVQGNGFVTGCLIFGVVMGYSPNEAAIISENKVTQTFLQHHFLKPQMANSVTLRIPFAYRKKAYKLGDVPYATAFLKVFNNLRTVPTDPPRITVSILSAFKECKFTLVNPLPDASVANLLALRRDFQERHDQRRSVRRRRARMVAAKSEMLQHSDAVLTTVPDVQPSMVSAGNTSGPGLALDGPNPSVNEMMKRMVPVAYLNAADAGAGSVLTVELAQIFSNVLANTTSRRSQLAWFGSVFAAFRGGVKAYAVTRAFDVQTLFTSGGRLSAPDMATLLIQEGSGNDILTTKTPWQYANALMGRQLFMMSPWISIDRFLVIPKTQAGDFSTNLGAFHFSTNDTNTNNNGIRVFCGFADTARFAIPVSVPRVLVRSTNVGTDNYPIRFGSLVVGEELLLEHEAGAPTLDWLTFGEALANANTSTPLNPTNVPQRVKAPAGSMRIPTKFFTSANLEALGLPITADQDYVIQDGLTTDLKADLTGVYCIPVVTALGAREGETDVYARSDVQPVLEGKLFNVTGSGAAMDPFTVGSLAIFTPPWDSDWLNTVWTLDVLSESPVARPVRAERFFDVTSRFVGTDGITYASIFPGASGTSDGLALNINPAP